MSDATLPARDGPPMRDPAPLRYGVAAGLVAVGGLLLWTVPTIRLREAELATHILRVLGGSEALTSGTSVVFRSKGDWVGYRITTGCSTALLLAPFVLVGAIVALIGRTRMRQMLGGLLVSLLVVIVSNQLRFLIVAWTVKAWGLDPGFDVGHIFLGNVVSIGGCAIGLFVFIYLITRRRDGDRRRADA